MSKKTRKKPSTERSSAKGPDRSSAAANVHFLYKPIVHISLIVLFGLIAYSNTFHAPFVFDDLYNIVENHRIKDISNIPFFFTHIEGAPISGRPLTAATFAINYYLDGLNTTGYHIVNLLLHITNGILLYFLIILTAERLGFHDDKKTIPIALFSSLIFIVHPVQTESVTYIVSRSVLLSTFFFFLGIILFAKAVGSAGKKRTAWIAALFIISLMGMASREEFLIFPFILILYDFFFISGYKIKDVIKHYRAYIPVFLTLSYLAFIVASSDYGDHTGFGVKEFTSLEYLMTQFNAHWTYLRLLVLPINQNLDYDYPIAKALFELPTILSFIGYIGLWGAGIYLYRRRPVISFCILWFMITLAPSSSIMPIIDVIFEHRLYMPSMGVAVVFILAISYYTSRITHHVLRLTPHGYPCLLSTLLLSAVVIVFSIATYQRNTVWQNEVSLWGDVVRKSPNKARGHNELGIAYASKGLFDKAIEHLHTTLRLEPGDADAHNNLGIVYHKKGLLDKAIEHYRTAMRLEPDYALAYNNLGKAYWSKGRFDEAIEHYRIALRLVPDFAEAHYNLGVTYERMGLIDEAIKQYQTALRLNTGHEIVENSLNRILQIQRSK